jgi:hypothetical protein
MGESESNQLDLNSEMKGEIVERGSRDELMARTAITNEEVSIRLGADPRLRKGVMRLQQLAPKADLSQLVRAAVLFFAESATERDIEVYVREQIYLDQS